jgi:hypothetical protein
MASRKSCLDRALGWLRVRPSSGLPPHFYEPEPLLAPRHRAGVSRSSKTQPLRIQAAQRVYALDIPLVSRHQPAEHQVIRLYSAHVTSRRAAVQAPPPYTSAHSQDRHVCVQYSGSGRLTTTFPSYSLHLSHSALRAVLTACGSDAFTTKFPFGQVSSAPQCSITRYSPT